MTFALLNNTKAMLKAQANATSNQFKDTNGNSHSFTNSGNVSFLKSMMPFFVGGAATISAPQTDYPCIYATSNESIAADTYQLSNQVGTSSCVYTMNNKGWTCNITITANENDVIKSFFCVRKLTYSGNTGGADTVIWVFTLDNPVTIDSTGTASFTFAVEYN